MLHSRNNTPCRSILLLSESVADPQLWPYNHSIVDEDAIHTPCVVTGDDDSAVGDGGKNSINEPFEKYKQVGKIKF